MAAAADIDQLIEEGLNRYGAGDLDGALMAWEEALGFDPHNPQLNSYVDYLRTNYDLLADSGIGLEGEDEGLFGLAEEPDYIIEILPGEPMIEAAEAPAYLDPLDEGWFIEEEATRDYTRDTREGIPLGMADTVMEAARTISADLPPQHFELEADEPPDPDIELPPPVRPSEEGVTFESSTREYGRENEFEETPSSFRAEATPLGFGSMETEVKKRELGFVQPTQGSARLEIRVRTPTSPPTGRLGSAPVASDQAEPEELQLGGAGRNDDEQRTPHGTMRGLAPVVRQPALGEDDATLALPQREAAPMPSRTIVPRRQSGSQSLAGNEPTDPGPVDPGAPTGEQPRIITRDLPGAPRRPASVVEDGTDDVDDIALPTASTRDLDPRRSTATDTERLGLATDDPFIASAPTRELGLRPGGRPPSVYPDEDAPTRQSDARAIREHNTAKLKPEPANRRVSPGDGTAHDIVLPFDPIDARSSGILEGLDDDAPAGESKEDRTRRRITLLLQRALAWNTEHDVDRAVTAVDLALNEDPNSALAQKLIHRNRETIMAVFQEYLGDLERQPQLARPLHELASTPISPRAAFLLSRIDGHLTVDEILDVSGMPRMEAYRHLCQLFLRGILR